MKSSRITVIKKILFLVICVFIGTVAGLLLGEVGLRIVTPAWLRQLMVGTNLDGDIHYGSDKGWPVETRNGKFVQFKPLKEFKVDYYEYQTLVHTDQWGGRLVPDAKRSQNHIPVLGDSFAFGLGVHDEETFVNLLSKKSGISYLNLAAPGSSLPNDLDIIEFRHKELGSPGVYLIAFYLGNDFADMMNYYESFNRQENSMTENSTVGLFESLYKLRVIQRSYVAQFIAHSDLRQNEKKRSKRKTRIFRAPGGQRIGNSIYLLMSGSRAYSSQARKVLDRSLSRLDALSKTLHFRPIFIVIPDKHQTDKALFIKQSAAFNLTASELDPFRPNQILEDTLDRHGYAYLDVMECLKDRPGMYYKIDDHLTAAGNRVVADCIHQDSKWNSIAELRVGDKP